MLSVTPILAIDSRPFLPGRGMALHLNSRELWDWIAGAFAKLVC
jgi:hypothetical protein